MRINDLSDAELLALLSTDSKDRAFRILSDRHRPFVLKKCHRLIRDINEAEDVTQAVFLKLFYNYASFERKSSFTTWLYAITYRTCLGYLREAKRITIKNINMAELKERYDHIDLEEDVDIETDKNLELLNLIEPFDKTLLIMKYKEGMRIKTISDALQLSEASIKMRLKRAKYRLMKLKDSQDKKNRN